MKMETAVYCPRDARVAEVSAKPNSIVTAKDLLVVLEEDPDAVHATGERMAPQQAKNDAKA